MHGHIVSKIPGIHEGQPEFVWHTGPLLRVHMHLNSSLGLQHPEPLEAVRSLPRIGENDVPLLALRVLAFGKLALLFPLLDPVRLKIPACHPALLHERSLRISHALVHMNNARQVREMNAGCL
mmetsp:Transcript_13290/g.40218  ORF Transcript_13290/g.40218 Transcript_13290/m.40218 type:complete len:123 (-) Transcript_13290:7-375(-)